MRANMLPNGGQLAGGSASANGPLGTEAIAGASRWPTSARGSTRPSTGTTSINSANGGPARWYSKGPLGPDDALRAIDAGVDGLHLSNHGGRQLDGTVATIDLVRPVRDAVGDRAVIVMDSGVRHGADIAVALARGADMCMIGRAVPVRPGRRRPRRGARASSTCWSSSSAGPCSCSGVASVAELRRHADQLVVEKRSPAERGLGAPRWRAGPVMTEPRPPSEAVPGSTPAVRRGASSSREGPAGSGTRAPTPGLPGRPGLGARLQPRLA